MLSKQKKKVYNPMGNMIVVINILFFLRFFLVLCFSGKASQWWVSTSKKEQIIMVDVWYKSLFSTHIKNPTWLIFSLFLHPFAAKARPVQFSNFPIYWMIFFLLFVKDNMGGEKNEFFNAVAPWNSGMWICSIHGF